MNAIKAHGKGKLGATLLACLMFVFALALTACSGSASAAAAALSQAVDSQTAMAMVTAVDGNEVTVQVMGGGSGGPGGDGNGQPPAKPGEDSTQSADNSSVTVEDSDTTSTSTASDQGAPSGDSNGQPPAMPGGDSNGQPPAMPGGDSNGQPPAMPGGDSNGQPPAMPGESSDQATDAASDASGTQDNASSDAQGNQPPSMPSGDNAQGGPGGQGGMPGGTEETLTINDESIIVTSADGGEEQASLADITEGTMLELTVADDGTTVTKIVVNQGMGQGGPGGESGQGAPGGQGSSTGNTGTGATTITSDTAEDGKTYASETADENALRVEGATATISNATVTKTGDSSSSEDSDFYGLNAGILALDSGTLTIEGGTVTTDSKGSNGIFAYGEGTTVNVSDATINCTQGNSGGIEVSGGATLNASNLTVDTQGQSSAAIRSDRGGGTETVTGGSYTTHGEHSPAVYSTADVTVNNAQLTAENCEGVVIEGLNSVTLNDCDLTANINDVATRTGISNGVMIYQSMSGDAQEGTGSFTMKGGTFANTSSTLFYVTNTSAQIALENVEIENSGDSVLVIAGNDGQWGNSGSNGGTVEFTAIDQNLDGKITVDDISALTLKLTSGSDFNGSINADGQAGEVNVELDAESTWTLSADSYVTSLTGDTSGINLNGHTLYVNGEAWQG